MEKMNDRVVEEALKDIVEGFPGATPLGVVSLDNGQVTQEQRDYIRDRLGKLLERAEPDPKRRARALQKLDEAIDDVTARFAMPELALRRDLPKARHALEKLGEMQDSIERHAMRLTSSKRRAVFELGQADAFMSLGRASMERALARIEHALDCDCTHEEEQQDLAERPTEPPPAEEASA